MGYSHMSGMMLGGMILGAILLWFSHRYAWWRPAVSWKRPRILMYHMVQPHRARAKFNGL